MSRNVNRARIRLALGIYRGRMGAEDEPRDPTGNIINEPSDDELPPPASEGSLLPQQPIPVLDPKWNSVQNPSAPKRTAPHSSRAAPDPRAHRVSGSSVSAGDLEFPHRHAMSSPASCLITVTAGRLRSAGMGAARGWPAFSVL